MKPKKVDREAKCRKAKKHLKVVEFDGNDGKKYRICNECFYREVI